MTNHVGETPNPTAEQSRAEHIAAITSMLKVIEWQIGRDYGLQWLAGELYDRGARAHGLLAEAPTEEQVGNLRSAYEEIRSEYAEYRKAVRIGVQHVRDVAAGCTLMTAPQVLDALSQIGVTAAGVAPQAKVQESPEIELSPSEISDREKLIAERLRNATRGELDGTAIPVPVEDCRVIAAALAARPVLDEGKLAEVISARLAWASMHWDIATPDMHNAVARAVIEAIRDGEL